MATHHIVNANTIKFNAAKGNININLIFSRKKSRLDYRLLIVGGGAGGVQIQIT